MKTSENDVKYSSFNMGEMDKSRELYSREGDNYSQFEGKTVQWEHTRALSGIFGRRQFSATQWRSLTVGCTSLSIAQ